MIQPARYLNIQLVLLLLFIGIDTGFGFTRVQQLQRECHHSISTATATTSTQLFEEKDSKKKSGWFNFDPFQGFGSGKDDSWKDEQFEAQQAILRAREDRGLTKDELSAKYKRVVEVQQDLEYTQPGLSRQETMLKNKQFAKQVSSTYNAPKEVEQEEEVVKLSTPTSAPPSFAFFASPAATKQETPVSTPPTPPSQQKKQETTPVEMPKIELPKFEIPKIKMPWEK